MPDRAYIALGSNLGDSGRILRDAVARLKQISTKPLIASSLWSSSPVDCPPGSPDFLNAAVLIESAQTPEDLLRYLQSLEREFGRLPKKVLNEARPLDLDLIAFGTEVRRTETLTLPHLRAHQRRFVLEPLKEIAPELVLPGQEKSVSELVAALATDEELRRVGPLD